MKNIILEYPKTIKSTEYSFKVNTDDWFDTKPLTDFLRNKGVCFKKNRTQSKTKCMGYNVFKIKSNKPIMSFQENIDFCEELFNDFTV